MDAATLIDRVCARTGMNREHAEAAVRATLVTLGTRIDPGEADDLAAQLPESLGGALRHEGDPEPFGPDEFCRRVARSVPLADEQVEDAVGAVFAVLREALSRAELGHVATQLGDEYASLTGLAPGTGTPSGGNDRTGT